MRLYVTLGCTEIKVIHINIVTLEEHARLFPGVVLLFQGLKQTCLRGYADLINGKVLVKDIN